MYDLNVSRRHLLGTAITSSIAGCTALGTESGVKLGNIQIGNTEEEPLTFKLRIERDGSVIYLDSIEVNAGALHDVERTWNSESGEFSVFYTTSFEEEIHSISIPADGSSGDTDCVDLRFYYHSSITDLSIYDKNKPEWSGC